MTIKIFLKKYFTDIAACPLIFLFVYASVSKLIAFERFRAQIGQSPLLTAYSGTVAWAVPLVEMGISAMLVFQKSRPLGFYASFSLMSIFSAYIVAITKFSDYVPCSCGGILQGMGWGQHFVFNIFFVLLSLAGIIFEIRKEPANIDCLQDHFIAIKAGETENL